MKYFNEVVFKNVLQNQLEYKHMLESMQDDVDAFCDTFEDNPTKTSRWGHHYFCQKDGGLLIYDPKQPKAHKCEICGEVYNNDLLNGVWVYMYRNNAIVNAWKSGLVYKATGEVKYLDNLKMIIQFYAAHYLEFKLHNKEGEEYETLGEMEWGCGRIMPQGLNESVWIIRMINALELVKGQIDEEFMTVINDMCLNIFEMIMPQVDKIHNISCWYNSAVGTMGLFLENQEMIEFAFEGEFNIRRQLREGVTADGFWYEGSIHYNFFTLEGITNLLMFSKLYEYGFGEEVAIMEKMFTAAYFYAFDNHQLPNPNDGWPNINLKSYSYIYAVAVKVFGIDSDIGNILKNILNKKSDRGVFPLSKPYYFENRISLERLVLIPEIDPSTAKPIITGSTLFDSTYNGILKNDKGLNIFYKYGHNGPSHAHPDKMNLEVVFGDMCLSRDLSNSGYGNTLCNEWHRMTVSHNTVVVNGKNHESTGPGNCLVFDANHMVAEAKTVYEGVDFKRDILLEADGFTDVFEVTSHELNHYDYFFHVEATLLTKIETRKASLAYDENGYQHINEIKQVDTHEPVVVLEWQLGDLVVTSEINMDGKTLFIADTPDNPVTKSRTTLVIATDGNHVTFNVKWKIRG